MRGRKEPVLGGRVRERLLELAVVQLAHRVALRTDEMVVMAGAADPVAESVAEVGERLDDACLGKRIERSVDGRQPDPLAAPSQPIVELLRGHIVALAQKFAQDADTLWRSAQTALA